MILEQTATPGGMMPPGWPRLWPQGGRPVSGLCLDLGRRAYAPIWELQRQVAAARHEGHVPDTLLLVEHPPTITIGRGGTRAHLLASATDLATMGATVVEVDRGGDITYHGPGQLVAYPVIDLLGRGRDIHRYLRLLEEAIIRTVAEWGLLAHRLPPHTGVWLGDEKVAAIGVKVSRGVALHGLALNIAPDLTHFDAIVPCGIRDKGVTSLAARLHRPPSGGVVAARLADHLGLLLGVDWSPRSGHHLADDALLAMLLDAAVPGARPFP